eukprot:Rmarinus@m.22223
MDALTEAVAEFNQERDQCPEPGSNIAQSSGDTPYQQNGSTEAAPTQSQNSDSANKPDKPEHDSRARIFVGGIPADTTAQTFTNYFRMIGPVKHTKLLPLSSRQVRTESRCGFVTFENVEHAQIAIKTLHKSELEGKTIRVTPAIPLAERREFPAPTIVNNEGMPPPRRHGDTRDRMGHPYRDRSPSDRSFSSYDRFDRGRERDFRGYREDRYRDPRDYRDSRDYRGGYRGDPRDDYRGDFRGGYRGDHPDDLRGDYRDDFRDYRGERDYRRSPRPRDDRYYRGRDLYDDMPPRGRDDYYDMDMRGRVDSGYGGGYGRRDYDDYDRRGRYPDSSYPPAPQDYNQTGPYDGSRPGPTNGGSVGGPGGRSLPPPPPGSRGGPTPAGSAGYGGGGGAAGYNQGAGMPAGGAGGAAGYNQGAGMPAGGAGGAAYGATNTGMYAAGMGQGQAGNAASLYTAGTVAPQQTLRGGAQSYNQNVAP